MSHSYRVKKRIRGAKVICSGIEYYSHGIFTAEVRFCQSNCKPLVCIFVKLTYLELFGKFTVYLNSTVKSYLLR